MAEYGDPRGFGQRLMESAPLATRPAAHASGVSAAAALSGAMHIAIRVTILGLLLAGAVGCGLFDSGSSHRKGASAGGERCDVDLDQWKARVKRFKDKKHQTKAEFQQAKDDLVSDLKKLDTSACKRELSNEVTDLVDQVKQEHF